MKVWASGENVIVDIFPEPAEGQDDWHDGSGWLAALAPLRSDLLSGDLRLFYLLWLTAVQDESVADLEVEPLPGIGPLTGPLEAFADFFGVDPDLVQAAAERDASVMAMPEGDLRETLAAISEREKAELLLRVVEGDALVASELRSKVRGRRPATTVRRSAGEITGAEARAGRGRTL